MWRKRNPCAQLVGMQTGATTVEDSMKVPQNIKNRTTLWSSNHTTEYLSKEYENTYSKGYMHPYVYCSIIYNSQITETAQLSINRWMNKDVRCIYNGILFCHKKWNLLIYNSMNGSREYNAKWNKSEKEKYHMISLMWNLRNKTYKQSLKKQRDKPENYREQMIIRGKAGGGNGRNR